MSNSLEEIKEKMTANPIYSDNESMFKAFLCLAVCLIEDDDQRNNFHEDTGHNLSSLVPKTSIEAMMDFPGMEDEMLTAWLDWVAENTWGLEGDDEVADIILS